VISLNLYYYPYEIVTIILISRWGNKTLQASNMSGSYSLSGQVYTESSTTLTTEIPLVFFFWGGEGYWGIELRASYLLGALPLEPQPYFSDRVCFCPGHNPIYASHIAERKVCATTHSFFVEIVVSIIFLSQLASNLNPPNIWLPSGWEYTTPSESSS
jgi:hypothetical protein